MIRLDDCTETYMPAPTPKGEYHDPVLLAEIVATLEPEPGKVFVDGTLGGGGHTEAFLKAGATVVGIDQDAEALAFATKRLKRFGVKFQPVHANYSDVCTVLDSLKIPVIHGALLDLGVSSHQLYTAERGFSFQYDGPLDMRMNAAAPMAAGDLVNSATEEELTRIFREYGEESAARRVAARIARERAKAPITRTMQLSELVSSVVPRRGRAHPATKVFQALRIAVNRELEVLETGLKDFSSRLASRARFGVITFHSLEDRIVKHFFRHRATEWLDKPEWPAPRKNPEYVFKLLTTHPVVAGETEQENNPRSRPAKFRAVERLNHGLC